MTALMFTLRRYPFQSRPLLGSLFLISTAACSLPCAAQQDPAPQDLKPNSDAARIDQLQQQVDLLQKEIEELRANRTGSETPERPSPTRERPSPAPIASVAVAPPAPTAT